MSYHPYGGGGPYAPPGYGGFPGGVPGGVPGGMQGGMPAGMPMNAPPGMVPPGLGPPPGMHTSNPAHTSRQPGLPIGFQPPANLPNINFNARVIRLGTSSKPSANGSSKDTDSPSSAHPGNSRTNGVIDRTEQSRVNAREAAQALVPPMPDEKLRTIFIGNIPEGANGTAGIEALLGSVGRLQRFDSSAPFQADKSELLFGFAQFEDAESVAAAIALLKDIELPTKKQSTPETEPIDTNDKFEGIDKTKLIVAVDEITIKYLDSKLTNESAKNARIESVRPAVKKAVRKLFYPPADTKDKATEQPTSEAVEVVNINLAQDDELADIPAEMREMVAGEIAAFRERSTQRDLERMKREEELEERERLRNNPNNGRTRSPLRGIPTGPKAANGRTNQIAFISSGLSHADLALYRDHDETDASDEELNRRELQKKKGEQDNQYFDAERKWVSRERSRTAALERERDRERHDAELFEKRKQEVLDQEREWDDAKERESKSHAYYRDHANWARKRALDRADEAARDEGDRQAEAEETRREKKDQDKARGLADSFLEAAGKEMAAGGAAAAVATTTKSAAPVAPQPFKLSLGAAAQKAQAQRNGRQRRTVAEVEGLLDDEEHEQQTKRQLVPIQFEASAADGMTEEEVQQAVKQLAGEIPVDKEGLWGWKVKWEYLDEEVIVEKLRPFVQKKIVEYLGVQEEVIVEVIEEHLRKHGGAGELVEELAEALDEVAEDLVKKLWRMVIFFTESEKRGLPA